MCSCSQRFHNRSATFPISRYARCSRKLLCIANTYYPQQSTALPVTPSHTRYSRPPLFGTAGIRRKQTSWLTDTPNEFARFDCKTGDNQDLFAQFVRCTAILEDTLAHRTLATTPSTGILACPILPTCKTPPDSTIRELAARTDEDT